MEKRILLTIVDGWTVFSSAADSQRIYVSSSGDDANDGLSESHPKKTIANALTLLRAGYPDSLLLKRGDTFTEGRLTLHFGGRSSNEPLVITGYGDGPRPILNESGFFYWGPNEPIGAVLDYVAIVGLDFSGRFSTNPAAAGNGKAILFRGDMSDMLIEDCRFDDYSTGLHLQQKGDTSVPSNITVRRNVFVDCAEMGILTGQSNTFTIEENMFDYNGFTNGPTKFSHNIYLKEMTNTVIRNNIFARGANFGTKLSSDIPDGFTDVLIENNLYFNNGIGLDHSSGSSGDVQTTFTHNGGLITGNVFTELGRTFADGSDQDLAGWIMNSKDLVWDANMFVHMPADSPGSGPMMRWGEHHKDMTVKDNIVYDWNIQGATPETYFQQKLEVIDGFTFEGNQIDNPAVTYVDPSRTVGSYYASIGGENDAIAFLQAARNVSKSNWSTAFTADAVNDYIKAGFARVLATPVFSTPNNTTTANPLLTVSWNTVNGADAYEVWYSNLTTGQNPAFMAMAASASYTPATALPIGQYQIWVRATQNGGPSSPWSTPITLRVNSPPALTSLPADGANARPLLTWTSVPGAVRYEVWGDNLTTGATKVVNATNVTQTSFTLASDLGFGVYRFWVRGFDAKGVFTTWSVAQDYSRVGVATVVQPVVFDGLNSLPTITWNTIAGAARYELWVSNLTTGQNGIIRDTSVSGSSFVATQPLPFGTNRFWVRAHDAAGLPSTWSLPLDAVNTPRLLSPVLPTFARRPTFTWAALPGVNSSEVYISVNGTVINPTGLSGTSWTPASDLPMGELKWWVRLKAANGVFGPWSARAEAYIGGRSAMLAAGVPGNDPARIGVFTWQAVTGASRYILHVERIGVGVVILESNLTSTSYTSSAPLAAGAYRAWIKAIDGSDNVTGIWSNAFAFTVVGVQAEEPNSPAIPQFAQSVLSDERLEAVSQIGTSEIAGSSQRVVLPNEISANRDADRERDIETESLVDWVHPNMSGDALMSELDADLIDMVMSESSRIAATL